MSARLRPRREVRDRAGAATMTRVPTAAPREALDRILAEVARLARTAQDEICSALERLDAGGRFSSDVWERPGGGGGISRVLQEGAVLEKAGVNVSEVHGADFPDGGALASPFRRGEARTPPSPPLARDPYPRRSRAHFWGPPGGPAQPHPAGPADFWAGWHSPSARAPPSPPLAPAQPHPAGPALASEFAAAGLSVVVHPRSPMVPTAHMNVRFLARGGAGWFGGGADLTPCYLFEEDCAHFHRVLRDLCERHAPGSHAAMKRAADDYFFLPHRGEHRGVGGIFFDDLGGDLDRALAFVSKVPLAFLDAYLPIVGRRKDLPHGEAERRWQEIRRGRYVEFNLVLDRGTRFGLETAGRTESILMSLPPRVRWPYDHRPEPGSREAALLDVLRRPRDWS